MNPLESLLWDTVLPLLRGLALDETQWSKLINDDGRLQGFLDLVSPALQVLEIGLRYCKLNQVCAGLSVSS